MHSPLHVRFDRSRDRALFVERSTDDERGKPNDAERLAAGDQREMRASLHEIDRRMNFGDFADGNARFVRFLANGDSVAVEFPHAAFERKSIVLRLSPSQQCNDEQREDEQHDYESNARKILLECKRPQADGARKVCRDEAEEHPKSEDEVAPTEGALSKA